MLMELSIKEIGQKINSMALELNSGQTALNLKVNTRTGKRKAWANSLSKTLAITKEDFYKMKSAGMASTIGLMAKRMKDNGRTIK